MKKLILLALLPVSMVARAGTCDVTEYAELKDLKRSELQAKYCHLKKYQEVAKAQSQNVVKEFGASLETAEIAGAHLKYSFQCEEQAKRVADLFERQYSAKPAACKTAE